MKQNNLTNLKHLKPGSLSSRCTKVGLKVSLVASVLAGTAYGSYLLYNQINDTTPAQEAEQVNANGIPARPTGSETLPADPRKPLSNEAPNITELKCEPYVNPGWDKSQICHISVSDDSKVSYCVVNSKTNNGDPKLKLKLQEHNYRMEINAAQGEFKFSPKEICAEPYCKGTMKARCYDNENKSSEEMKTEIKIEPTFHVTANRVPLNCAQPETIDDLLIYPAFKGKIISDAQCSVSKLPDGLRWDKSRLRIYGSCLADLGRYLVRVTCKYSGISASKQIKIIVQHDK